MARSAVSLPHQSPYLMSVHIDLRTHAHHLLTQALISTSSAVWLLFAAVDGRTCAHTSMHTDTCNVQTQTCLNTCTHAHTHAHAHAHTHNIYLYTFTHSAPTCWRCRCRCCCCCCCCELVEGDTLQLTGLLLLLSARTASFTGQREGEGGTGFASGPEGGTAAAEGAGATIEASRASAREGGR